MVNLKSYQNTRHPLIFISKTVNTDISTLSFRPTAAAAVLYLLSSYEIFTSYHLVNYSTYYKSYVQVYQYKYSRIYI